MGDAIEGFRALKEMRREERARIGVACQGCVLRHPKRHPSILLPGQQCKVCGFRRPPQPPGRA